MIDYLDKSQFSKIVDYLFKGIDSVAATHEGAQTLDAYIKKSPNKKEVKAHIEELLKYDINDPNTHEKIENLAVKIIEKKAYYYPLQQSILAEGLRILIPAEREKIVEVLVNELPVFIPHKEGAKLFCYAIDRMDVKDRKNLLKSFKGKVKEFLEVQNGFAHIFFIKIFASIDDTVLVKKTILNDLLKEVDDNISSEHIAEIFLSIYDKDSSFLEKYGIIAETTTSKKDDATRKSELIQYILGKLVDVLSFDLPKFMVHPHLSKLLYLVIKNIFEGNHEEYYSLGTSAVTTIIDNYKNNSKTNDSEKDLLICHPVGHRFVKSLVIDYQTYQGIQEYSEMIEKIFELVQTEMAVLIQTKAIFVLIAFIEHTDFKDQLIQELQRQSHLINDKGAGMNILKKLYSN